MNLLLAFDKFKGSMTAVEACKAARAGVMEARPAWNCHEAPLTDGGDGFVEVLIESAGGNVLSESVAGPDGRPVEAVFGLVESRSLPGVARRRLKIEEPGKIAVIEMAQASGLSRLDPRHRDPRFTVSTGVGELIRAASLHNPCCILLGVGGSATHDLGMGALGALGLTFRNRSLPSSPSNWGHLGEVQAFDPPSLPPIKIACDVTNPLVGTRGAARVFAEQKGLPATALDALEEETKGLALTLTRFFGKEESLVSFPGSGAAGGIAFGLMVALEAELLPGSALTAEWLDLERWIDWADEVWTGEGRFDDSSLEGKGPGYVLETARAKGKKVAVLAGSISLSGENKSNRGAIAHLTLTGPGISADEAVRQAPSLLHKMARDHAASI